MFSTWEYTSYTMKIVSEKHQLFIGVYLFIYIVYGVQIYLVHGNSPLGYDGLLCVHIDTRSLVHWYLPFPFRELCLLLKIN